MKVVSATEMARIEKLAYQEGASEEAFMDAAGSGIAQIIEKYEGILFKHRIATLLCGKGNNAGDAYVVGLSLLKKGYQVSAIQIPSINECSSLCKKKHDLFVSSGGKEITYSNAAFPQEGIIIDGIFGTGFHGSVHDPYFSVIVKANNSKLPIFAVDIPSGLNGNLGWENSIAINATVTIFLELPKTGFFINNAWNYVGILERSGFGLGNKYPLQAHEDFFLLTVEEVKNLLPPIIRNRNKYQAGHVVGFAGSRNMPGAALLSSLAVLRGGAGIIKLLHPEEATEALVASEPEIIKIPVGLENPNTILDYFRKASSVFVGPGIGREPPTLNLMQKLIPKIEKPCVINGDALTIVAENNIPIPKDAVLTPHTGEMARLLHLDSFKKLDREFIDKCQNFSDKNDVVVVLKGGPTFIFTPRKKAWICTRGDPGMATAGSGDVLTGLLAALLAQGLNGENAAKLGVYLHGLAGEFAAREKTSYAVIAGDIIEHLSTAYRAVSR